jgi:hypothetical protein
MPYKDPERKRQVWRESKRRQRAKQKEEAMKSVDPLDLNYGMKPTKPKFMTFEEYCEEYPDSTKTDWIRAKIVFDHEQSLPKSEEPEEDWSAIKPRNTKPYGENKQEIPPMCPKHGVPLDKNGQCPVCQGRD